jgi:hypothetical protein
LSTSISRPKALKNLLLSEVCFVATRRRRLASKVMVSSEKFLRVVILPLHGKDFLGGKEESG